jgi:hypothetical protein
VRKRCTVNPAKSLATPPPQTFLIASDLHFNPFADPTLVAALSAAPPGQWERILNQSKLGDPPPSAPKAQRCVFTARLRLWSTRKEEQVLASHLDLPVNIPRGSHPFPSRTQKLSLACGRLPRRAGDGIARVSVWERR